MTSLPVCAVCDHPFKYQGPTPHLLPCLHSLCRLCLKSPEIQRVTCGVCVRQFDIDGEVHPVSHVVSAEVLRLTSENQPTEITCTNKEDGHQAVCWCQECSDYLCEHCQTSHSEVKITRKHTLHRLSEVARVQKDIQLICSDHGLPKDLYDKDCDCFICSQCFVSQHESHKTLAAGEITKQEDATLRETLKSVSNKKEEVQDALTGVNTHEEIINERFSTLQKTVEHAFSELKIHLDQREKMVLVQLDLLKNSMHSANNSRRPLLKALDTSCQTTLDFTDKCLQYIPAEHLIQMKKAQEEATRYCVDGEIARVQQHEASVSFLKQGMNDVKDTISTFGSFVTAPRPSELPDSSTSFQCVTKNIMKKKMEDYENELEQSSVKLNSLTLQADLNQNTITEMQNTISQQKNVLEKITNDRVLEHSCFRIIKSKAHSMQVLKLQAMALDSEKSHIDFEVRDGCFLERNNDPVHRRKKSYTRLQTYTGTCATSPLPLSDNPFSPRAASYWEVEVDLDVDCLKRYKNDNEKKLLFEVAVCDEKVMDKDFCIWNHDNSCSLVCGVNSCSSHVELHAGTKLIFVKNVNDLVYSKRFQLGLLWDTNSRKVTFLDCINMEMLGSGTIPDDSTRVWPMFVIQFGTKLKLVSGADIKIGMRKEVLISRALS